MPAIVMVSPVGSPKCLTPLKQQSPGGPARTGDFEVMVLCFGSRVVTVVWDRGSLDE